MSLRFSCFSLPHARFPIMIGLVLSLLSINAFAAPSPSGAGRPSHVPTSSVPDIPDHLKSNLPPSPQVEHLQNTIETELDGAYPAMTRKSSPPLGTLQAAWQHPKTSEGQLAPGIVRYSWSPAFVMAVRLRDYMTTTLQFPAWERISSFYLGDPYIFQVQQVQPNTLILRSQNAGADTNFTAVGSGGNIYNFYLRSESWNSAHISDFTVYVDAPLPTSSEKIDTSPAKTSALKSPLQLANHEYSAMPDYLRSIVFKPENMQFDLTMYANTEEDAHIAPEHVWHDGVFTYFDYGARADQVQRPAIYLVIDGIDTMVNTRSAGPHNQMLIAEAVGNFSLRNGRKTVCVKRNKTAPEIGRAFITHPRHTASLPPNTLPLSPLSPLRTPVPSFTKPTIEYVYPSQERARNSFPL